MNSISQICDDINSNQFNEITEGVKINGLQVLASVRINKLKRTLNQSVKVSISSFDIKLNPSKCEHQL